MDDWPAWRCPSAANTPRTFPGKGGVRMPRQGQAIDAQGSGVHSEFEARQHLVHKSHTFVGVQQCKGRLAAERGIR